MPEFTFDIMLSATIRVTAENEEQARAHLRHNLDCADTHFGAWDHTGDPILAEASLIMSPQLAEIDGEAV